MTFESLKATILALIDASEEDFDADGDLIDFGLDSMQVFELVSKWQEEGIPVSFMDIAQEPTLNGWWRVLSARIGQKP